METTAYNITFSAIHLESLGLHLNINKNTTEFLATSTTQLHTYSYEYAYINGSVQVDGSDAFVVTPRISSEIPIWLIPCYGVILFFAIVGNLLVISTLAQNRRMRTITNVFLLNLAISDMLLGVLCMPVTLVGTLLRHFIFGEFLCKLIQFSQAASVAVSSWTLVAISCERYYAICHPLRSRTWQTINHAYRIIGFIWFGSIICMTPIALFSQLIPTSRQGLRKCREQWPDDTIAYERSFNIFLDLVLLVLPLFILSVAYILITRTLYVGMPVERALIFGGYANASTVIKQHDDSPLATISTVTESTSTCIRGTAGATTRQSAMLRGLNLSMPLCCHRRKANLRNDEKDDTDLAIETQRDMGCYQQQPQQPLKQIKYYDNSIAGGDISVKAFSISSTKTPKSVFGLRMLSRLAIAEHQTELQATLPPQQQQLQQNSMASHLNGCNNNDSQTSSNSAPTLFVNHQQTHQPNHHNLRANLRQQKSNQKLQQLRNPYLLEQVPLQMQQKQLTEDRRKSNSTPSLRLIESALRRSNEAKNLESKKRVVKMLFVLVLEFFICWTPLYVINTVAMFIGPAIYEYIDYTSICFCQLLAYSSSCCNPITYCFMNANFRRSFLDTFKGLHFSGSNDSTSIGGWRRRRKHHDGWDSVIGSQGGAQLPTFGTNESFALTNNAIIATENLPINNLQRH